jgi:hypothetical protein
LKIKDFLDGVKSGALPDTQHWIQKVCWFVKFSKGMHL